MHELRLTFRGTQRSNRIAVAIAITFMAVITLLAGLPLAVLLRRVPVTLTPILVASFDTAVVVLFTLILSQTLSNATLVFYERGDLDLLLSSPVPPHRVLLVRALAIAATPFLIFSGLLTPFLVPIAIYGHPQWLGAYGVLGALTLAATAAGLALAMGLFRLIGPRRTRTAGQLLAAFVGAIFFVSSQIRNFLPGQVPSLLSVLKSMVAAGYFHTDSPIAFPARAVMGEPRAVSAFVIGAGVLFFATVSTIGSRFSNDASLAAGAGIPTRSARPRRTFNSWARGVFPVLVQKELTLLRRDPALLSLVFLRVLYFLPLVFVLVRSAIFHLVGQLETGAGILVFACSQIASSLSWITVSAEDARDLLKSAPLSTNTVRLSKITAAVLPLMVLLAVPICVMGWFSPWVGFVTAVALLLSSASMGLISLWFESPGQRKTFRRQGGGSLMANLSALVLGLCWAATTVGVAAGSWFSLIGLGITIAVVFGLYSLRSSGRL